LITPSFAASQRRYENRIRYAIFYDCSLSLLSLRQPRAYYGVDFSLLMMINIYHDDYAAMRGADAY